jgi:dTDP-glucose pyrophosphorylase
MIEKYADKNNVKGEYYITEPINKYVSKGGRMVVVKAEGDYLDSGTVEGWLKANQIVIGNSID